MEEKLWERLVQHVSGYERMNQQVVASLDYLQTQRGSEGAKQ